MDELWEMLQCHLNMLLLLAVVLTYFSCNGTWVCTSAVSVQVQHKVSLLCTQL